MLHKKQLAAMIEGTEVSQVTTESDVRHLIKLANEYRFACVGIVQCFHALAKELLAQAGNNDTVIVGCCGYPLGSDSTTVKLMQIRDSLATGCKEMDLTNNLSWVKSGMYAEMEEELKRLVDACEGIPTKVIIEITKLSDDETKRVCEACVRAGATYIKTGTGTGLPTTPEHIRLIKSIVGDDAKIKASGGIRDIHIIEEMVGLGANRFGVGQSHIPSILDSCPD